MRYLWNISSLWKQPLWKKKDGMEMVQVAILVAIAVAIGIIFKSQITAFINDVFSKLDSSQF